MHLLFLLLIDRQWLDSIFSKLDIVEINQHVVYVVGIGGSARAGLCHLNSSVVSVVG